MWPLNLAAESKQADNQPGDPSTTAWASARERSGGLQDMFEGATSAVVWNAKLLSYPSTMRPSRHLLSN